MTEIFYTSPPPQVTPVFPAYKVPRYKRVMDIAFILLAFPILIPAVLMIALAQKITTGGPIFFFQTRVGLGGRCFQMVKFRSMYVDAEAILARSQLQSERDGICFKHRQDPRITPLGRFLRRSSLDELPQLWNVLRGDMSLVGPRPALPQEVARYPQEALARLQGLPGLSGSWQVSGRADIGFDEMVALDVDYLQNASAMGDLIILLRTVGAVTSGRGAY